MRKALSIQRRVLSINDPNLYVSVNSLASILNALKEFEESITLYEKADRTQRTLIGFEHPKTLISLASYAFLLNKTQQFAKALPAHKRVLKGRQKSVNAQTSEDADFNVQLCHLLAPFGVFVTIGCSIQTMP